MGNLRDKYTDQEWGEMEDKLILDRDLGKPSSSIIQLSIFGKGSMELKELRKAIAPFFTDSELRDLDSWITWKDNQPLRAEVEKKFSELYAVLISFLKDKECMAVPIRSLPYIIERMRKDNIISVQKDEPIGTLTIIHAPYCNCI